jgi:hypothetical protein
MVRQSATPTLTPLALKDAPALIETVFPAHIKYLAAFDTALGKQMLSLVRTVVTSKWTARRKSSTAPPGKSWLPSLPDESLGSHYLYSREDDGFRRTVGENPEYLLRHRESP